MAAAATAEHVNVLLGALGASWVFFLRHVSASDIPRRSVLLLYATLALGIFLLVWGVTWKLHRYYRNEWVIGIESIFAVVVFVVSTNAVRRFEAAGVLPAWIVRAWCAFVRRTERGVNT